LRKRWNAFTIFLSGRNFPGEKARPHRGLSYPGETFHMTSWTIATFTHRGRVRPDNEDAIAIGDRILTGAMDAPVVMTAPIDSCLLHRSDRGSQSALV
jgi:hypothetical protein